MITLNIFKHKNQPPTLYKKVTFKSRVESFLYDNQMWLLAWCVAIGSLSCAAVLLILFFMLAPKTIGGII